MEKSKNSINSGIFLLFWKVRKTLNYIYIQTITMNTKLLLVGVIIATVAIGFIILYTRQFDTKILAPKPKDHVDVKVYSPEGIHDPTWKDFDMGSMYIESTIKDVFDKLGKSFNSGYHYHNVRFKYGNKLLPFNTKLKDLICSQSQDKLVLNAVKIIDKTVGLPDINWRPDVDTIITKKETG
jgi:hypothetical protein